MCEEILNFVSAANDTKLCALCDVRKGGQDTQAIKQDSLFELVGYRRDVILLLQVQSSDNTSAVHEKM